MTAQPRLLSTTTLTLVWVGVPAAWVTLLTSIAYRVFS